MEFGKQVFHALGNHEGKKSFFKLKTILKLFDSAQPTNL